MFLGHLGIKRTDPEVGAMVWAGGSQVCSGKIGTLTARPVTRKAATTA